MYNSTTSEILYSSTTSNSGTKTFIIDHPVDPDRYLIHACMEGPEVGVYYRGKGEIVDGCSTVVSLPDYVGDLAYEFSIIVSPIYSGTANPRFRCSEFVERNQFIVYGENGKFAWTVYAKRNEIDVEPDKAAVELKGDGPYTWLSTFGKSGAKSSTFHNL